MKTTWINPLPSISESEQQEGVEILEGNNVIKVIIHPVVIAEDNTLDVAEMYRDILQVLILLLLGSFLCIPRNDPLRYLVGSTNHYRHRHRHNHQNTHNCNH